jgi:hypothetical protein
VIRQFLTQFLDRLDTRGRVYTVRGFRVVVENTRPDIATADVIERLGEALALVERYSPRRSRHLGRDVALFRVVRYPCRGAFLPHERACITELTFLARRDITAAPVAASILHEGMHARVHALLERLGEHPAGRDRAREERLCREVELDFGRALPPDLGRPVIERALNSLALDDASVAPEVDWALAAERMRSADGKASGG